MPCHATVGAKALCSFLLESDVYAIQRVAELLVRDNQCPRQFYDFLCNLIILKHPVVAVGKLVYLECTAQILLDDKRIEQVEVQILQSH